MQFYPGVLLQNLNYHSLPILEKGFSLIEFCYKDSEDWRTLIDIMLQRSHETWNLINGRNNLIFAKMLSSICITTTIYLIHIRRNFIGYDLELQRNVLFTQAIYQIGPSKGVQLPTAKTKASKQHFNFVQLKVICSGKPLYKEWSG